MNFRNDFNVNVTSIRHTQLPDPKFERFSSDVSPDARVNFQEALEFEMTGIDVPMVNALRRILISDVETMAIESVFYEAYQGVLAEEVLAHRLGLIPLFVDPKQFTNTTKSMN